MKKVYFNGLGSISAQHSFNDSFLEEAVFHTANIIPAIDPVYKDYIPPAAARRMAKGIKMGVVASKIAMQQAQLENVDAIITGTGMGCLRDSEKFLSAILDNDEQYLTPTSFIQSTHNTVAGQIALSLGCKGYNFTYVHASTSLEAALLDAQMMLQANEAHNILVGGVDEIADHNVHLHQLNGHIKQEEISANEVLSSSTPGAVFSEGAHFFCLSDNKKDSSYASLEGIQLYNTLTTTEVEDACLSFLQEHQLAPEDIDVLVLGTNGDIDFDGYYTSLQNSLFTKTSVAHYKHLSGEYGTATGFGLWIALKAIKEQHLPAAITTKASESPKAIKTVLLYHQYRGENHSFTLLQGC